MIAIFALLFFLCPLTEVACSPTSIGDNVEAATMTTTTDETYWENKEQGYKMNWLNYKNRKVNESEVRLKIYRNFTGEYNIPEYVPSEFDVFDLPLEWVSAMQRKGFYPLSLGGVVIGRNDSNLVCEPHILDLTKNNSRLDALINEALSYRCGAYLSHFKQQMQRGNRREKRVPLAILGLGGIAATLFGAGYGYTGYVHRRFSEFEDIEIRLSRLFQEQTDLIIRDVARLEKIVDLLQIERDLDEFFRKGKFQGVMIGKEWIIEELLHDLHLENADEIIIANEIFAANIKCLSEQKLSFQLCGYRNIEYGQLVLMTHVGAFTGENDSKFERLRLPKFFLGSDLILRPIENCHMEGGVSRCQPFANINCFPPDNTAECPVDVFGSEDDDWTVTKRVNGLNLIATKAKVFTLEAFGINHTKIVDSKTFEMKVRKNETVYVGRLKIRGFSQKTERLYFNVMERDDLLKNQLVEKRMRSIELQEKMRLQASKSILETFFPQLSGLLGQFLDGGITVVIAIGATVLVFLLKGSGGGGAASVSVVNNNTFYPTNTVSAGAPNSQPPVPVEITTY